MLIGGTVGDMQYGAHLPLIDFDGHGWTARSLAAYAGAARQLGTQAGPNRIKAVAGEAGLTRFRLAAQTPFNHVYEVRP